jgi:Fe(3+) dicitrate transport protein
MNSKLAVLVFCLFPTLGSANEPAVLDAVRVEASSDKVRKGGEISGEGIQTAKKITIAPVLNPPPQNNYRQALASVPGLLVSEVNNESWASLSYRGLGDPHETYNIQMLRNGLSIAADMYGYPAAYYNPPMAAVEAIEFYGTGASLLFGPQPGGALNYRLRSAPARAKAWALRTELSAGSNELLSGYFEASKGWDRSGFLGSYHQRQSKGFREFNSDYRILNPRLEARYKLSDEAVISLDLDHYDGNHGEPGGLARVTQGGFLGIDGDRSRSTLRNDRLEIGRTAATIGWEADWRETGTSIARFWYSDYDRNSYRQAVGNSNVFGFAATGSTNTIQKHEFRNLGADIRWKKNYSFFDKPQAITVALSALSVDSPFEQSVGSTAVAREGTKTREIQRDTRAVSLAVENKSSYGAFSFVPGIRIEHIDQKISEGLNIGASVPLRRATRDDTVILGGLGLSYLLNGKSEFYANLSQGFKPVTFQDAVPLSTGDTISGDIQEGKSLSAEMGWRGEMASLSLDASAFMIRYKNQFGRVGRNFQNVGDAEHLGLDIYASYEFVPGFEAYLGGLWMDAQFTRGPNLDRQPQYAPKVSARPGVRYRCSKGTSLDLQGQYLVRHFGDDGNTANFEIPSYAVWDLSGEVVPSDLLSLGGHWPSIRFGVQNLLDRKYWARVRSNGIEPGSPRTFHLGLNFQI